MTILKLILNSELYENQMPVRGPPIMILNSYYLQLVEKIKNSKNEKFEIKLLSLTPKNDLWKIAFSIKNNLSHKIEFIGIEVLNLTFKNSERFKKFFQTEDLEMFNYVMGLNLDADKFFDIPNVSQEFFKNIICEEKKKKIEKKTNYLNLFKEMNKSDVKKVTLLDHISSKHKKFNHFFDEMESLNIENQKNNENEEKKKNNKIVDKKSEDFIKEKDIKENFNEKQDVIKVNYNEEEEDINPLNLLDSYLKKLIQTEKPNLKNMENNKTEKENNFSNQEEEYSYLNDNEVNNRKENEENLYLKNNKENNLEKNEEKHLNKLNNKYLIKDEHDSNIGINKYLLGGYEDQNLENFGIDKNKIINNDFEERENKINNSFNREIDRNNLNNTFSIGPTYDKYLNSVN